MKSEKARRRCVILITKFGDRYVMANKIISWHDMPSGSEKYGTEVHVESGIFYYCEQSAETLSAIIDRCKI